MQTIQPIPQNEAYAEASATGATMMQRSRNARSFQRELRHDLIQARWDMRKARNDARKTCHFTKGLAAALAFEIAQGDYLYALDRKPVFVPLAVALRRRSWGL